MITNEKGNVEIYDFEIERFSILMEHSIELLRKLNDPSVDHITQYIRIDLDQFKRTCGLKP